MGSSFLFCKYRVWKYKKTWNEMKGLRHKRSPPIRYMQIPLFDDKICPCLAIWINHISLGAWRPIGEEPSLSSYTNMLSTSLKILCFVQWPNFLCVDHSKIRFRTHAHYDSRRHIVGFKCSIDVLAWSTPWKLPIKNVVKVVRCCLQWLWRWPVCGWYLQ